MARPAKPIETPWTKPQCRPIQRDIRSVLIYADLVDCMVTHFGQLLYSRQITIYLCFFAKNKAFDAKRDFSDRRKQTIFIDAHELSKFPIQVDQHEHQHPLAA